jgi:type IV pilus assembly protein PilC
MSQFILVMPVFGTLFKKIYITRFARSFGVLIKGGIPMTQAIEIAADTIGNVIYRELLSAIAQGVREGAMFSQLLVQETKYFPVMVGQMAAVGESTGRLEQMMGRVASFYDEEINDTMANLGELIQPMLILVIGLLVGLLFASILLPIYNLAQSFQI